MIDCDLLSKVYINLIDQKEPKLDFKTSHNDINKNYSKNINYYKKIISPSPEEIERHKKYLKNNLKKNYF